MSNVTASLSLSDVLLAEGDLAETHHDGQPYRCIRDLENLIIGVLCCEAFVYAATMFCYYPTQKFDRLQEAQTGK